jgi:hypothetical protein
LTFHTNSDGNFTISSNERMRIDNSGNVGIGTLTPTERLNVSGNVLISANLTATTITATTYQNLPNSLRGLYLPTSGGTVSGNTIFTQNISVTGGTGTNWFSGNSSSDLVRVTQTGSGNAFVVEDETNPDSTSFVINSGGSVSIGTTRVFSVGGSAETKLNISNGSSGLATTGLTVSTPLIVESSVTSSIGMLSPDNQLSQIYFGTPSDTFGAVLRWDYTNKNFNLGTSTTAGKLIFLTGTYDEAARINQSGNFGIGTTNPTARLTVSGGSNSGVARIGEVRSGYVGITLNSSSAETNYNIISSSGDTTLYINRPSTKDIRFRENNVDQVTIQGTTGNVGIGTSTPGSPLVIQGVNSILDFEPASAGGTITVSGNTGIPRFDAFAAPFGSRPGIGLSVGIRTWDDATYVTYGKVGDGFVRSGNDTNGLNLINTNGTNTEDYIRFYAGQTPESTSDIHIHGTGTTRGFVGLGTESPAQKLHVVGNAIVNGNLTVTGGTQTLISGNSSSEMVRIIQVGSGDAFVVEDQANNDETHFVIDASGNTSIGTAVTSRKLTVSGDSTFIHNPINSLTSSVSGYGDVVTFGTGSLTAGNLYYFTSGGAWSNADADSTTLSTGLLGIALGTTATTSGVLIRGYVRSASYTASTGSKLYVSPTAGSITSTAPSVAGQILRIIGYQLNSTNNVVYFNPSNDWIEL